MTNCVNAEHCLHISTQGRAKPCCMYEDDITKPSGEAYNVTHDSLDSIFNSEHLQQLRKNLRSGIKDPGCKKCWDEEAAGKRSKRIRDNDIQVFTGSKTGLKILDLNLGTLCNIKCRTCSPVCSTQWMKEWFALDEPRQQNPKKTWQEYVESRKVLAFQDDSSFWQSLHDVAPNIEHLDFYGGEPFLIKKQWEFIRFCADNDLASTKSVHFNTNCTIWPGQHIQYLKKFKSLNLGLSIDGVGDHDHYLRYPTDWSVVDANVDKWYEHCLENPTTSMTVCMTLSPMNIYYIDEIVDYVNSKNVKFNSNILNIFLNLVHIPSHFNISKMPLYLKEAVLTKLEPLMTDPVISHQLDGVIQFIKNGESDLNNWENFKRHIVEKDQYRGQDFKVTFPEVYAIMKHHGDDL